LVTYAVVFPVICSFQVLTSLCRLLAEVVDLDQVEQEGALLGPLQRMKGRVEVLEGLPTVDLEGSVEPQQPQQ